MAPDQEMMKSDMCILKDAMLSMSKQPVVDVDAIPGTLVLMSMKSSLGFLYLTHDGVFRCKMES